MAVVKIPGDPARRAYLEDERWDEDEAAIAEAATQGRKITDEEAAEMHRAALKAFDGIIVWCGLSVQYDLEDHRTAVFEMREKFRTLIDD